MIDGSIELLHFSYLCAVIKVSYYREENTIEFDNAFFFMFDVECILAYKILSHMIQSSK